MLNRYWVFNHFIFMKFIERSFLPTNKNNKQRSIIDLNVIGNNEVIRTKKHFNKKIHYTITQHKIISCKMQYNINNNIKV